MSCSCVVPGCKTNPTGNPRKGRLKKSIFKFPMKNSKLLDKWISLIPRDWARFSFSNSGTRICEDHFEDKFKIKSESGKFVRLADEAIPTIFDQIDEEFPDTKSKNSREGKISDFSDACRFCLAKMSDCRIEIDENLKFRFESLTQMELKSSIVYSSHICSSCNRNLEYAFKFRTKLVIKQTKLYQALKGFEENAEGFEQGEIKEESELHEDDNFLDLSLEIKKEPDEDSFEDENEENKVEKSSRKSKKRASPYYAGPSEAFDFPKIEDGCHQDGGNF